MMIEIMILAVLGSCIALYTYLLEQKVKKMPQYKPMCDISDAISCTKPMKSSYASLFYISNAFLAFIFYVLIVVLALFQLKSFLMVIGLGGCAMSCVLAYLLYFRIKSLCILCTTLYIINFLLLYVLLRR